MSLGGGGRATYAVPAALACSARAARPCVGSRRRDELDLLGVHHLALREHRRLLHDVAQLAHVARPLVPEQPLERLVGQPPRRRAVALGEEAEEALGDRDDVLGAIAQRRNGDREDVEAIVEVLAELVRFDEVEQIAVGGGDDRARRRRAPCSRRRA